MKSVELDSRNLLANEALDGGNLLNILAGHNRESVADALSASSAADAMDVVFGMMRHIEVDDVADLRHVNASRGDVGGYHHLITAVAKTIQSMLAFPLSSARMENGDGMTLLMELAYDPVGSVFGAAKNQHLIVVRAPE